MLGICILLRALSHLVLLHYGQLLHSGTSDHEAPTMKILNQQYLICNFPSVKITVGTMKSKHGLMVYN